MVAGSLLVHARDVESADKLGYKLGSNDVARVSAPGAGQAGAPVDAGGEGVAAPGAGMAGAPGSAGGAGVAAPGAGLAGAPGGAGVSAPGAGLLQGVQRVQRLQHVRQGWPVLQGVQGLQHLGQGWPELQGVA